MLKEEMSILGSSDKKESEKLRKNENKKENKLK